MRHASGALVKIVPPSGDIDCFLSDLPDVVDKSAQVITSWAPLVACTGSECLSWRSPSSALVIVQPMASTIENSLYDITYFSYLWCSRYVSSRSSHIISRTLSGCHSPSVVIEPGSCVLMT